LDLSDLRSFRICHYGVVVAYDRDDRGSRNTGPAEVHRGPARQQSYVELPIQPRHGGERARKGGGYVNKLKQLEARGQALWLSYLKRRRGVVRHCSRVTARPQD
jgi:hypothetical protein